MELLPLKAIVYKNASNIIHLINNICYALNNGNPRVEDDIRKKLETEIEDSLQKEPRNFTFSYSFKDVTISLSIDVHLNSISREVASIYHKFGALKCEKIIITGQDEQEYLMYPSNDSEIVFKEPNGDEHTFTNNQEFTIVFYDKLIGYIQKMLSVESEYDAAVCFSYLIQSLCGETFNNIYKINTCICRWPQIKEIPKSILLKLSSLACYVYGMSIDLENYTWRVPSQDGSEKSLPLPILLLVRENEWYFVSSPNEEKFFSGFIVKFDENLNVMDFIKGNNVGNMNLYSRTISEGPQARMRYIKELQFCLNVDADLSNVDVLFDLTNNKTTLQITQKGQDFANTKIKMSHCNESSTLEISFISCNGVNTRLKIKKQERIWSVTFTNDEKVITKEYSAVPPVLQSESFKGTLAFVFSELGIRHPISPNACFKVFSDMMDQMPEDYKSNMMGQLDLKQNNSTKNPEGRSLVLSEVKANSQNP